MQKINYRDIPPNEQWIRPMDITGRPLRVELIAIIFQQSAAPLLGAFAEEISIHFPKQRQKKKKKKDSWMVINYKIHGFNPCTGIYDSLN